MKILIVIFLFLIIQLTYQQSSDDCGNKYGCFLVPSGCSDQDCNFIVKWIRTDENDIQFLLNTKVDLNSWYGIGFSTDQIMANDSVVICKLLDQKSTAESYYNNYHAPPDILNTTDRSAGLRNINVTYKNGWLFCEFSRLIKDDSLGQRFFDLDEMFYLLVAKGPLSNSEPTYHDSQKDFSANKIDFRNNTVPAGQDYTFLKLHGSIMIVSWIILSTTGILHARYFKNIRRKMCGFDFWFAIHRPCMIAVTLLSLAAFIMIFYQKNWTWVDPRSTKGFIHSLCGATTICLALIQPIIASFRPDKNAPRRPLFNIVHRTIGISAVILSNAAIFLGVYTYVGTEISWILVTVWFVWLIFAIVLLEVNKSKNQETYQINVKPSAYVYVNVPILLVFTTIGIGIILSSVLIFWIIRVGS